MQTDVPEYEYLDSTPTTGDVLVFLYFLACEVEYLAGEEPIPPEFVVAVYITPHGTMRHLERPTVLAEPYTAMRCPDCKVWVYVADGPFAEDNDPTKPMADYLHWRAEHASLEDLEGTSHSFPLFTYNDQPVDAVKEGRTK